MKWERGRKRYARVSWDGGIKQDIPSDRSQATLKREHALLKPR